ncbi:MarC family protein [Candidatus Micrarchaeota archaeon]|nr:MarC family protein [Candidatus Micrarchaeota archaeon]
MELLASFIKSFVLLFAIMDPFSCIPIFVSLTSKFKEVERRKSANEAILVAALLIAVFALFGTSLLDLLAIRMSDFMVAGGLVIGLLGLQLMFADETPKKASNYQLAAVIIATPMLTGPGVISTVIVLTVSEGLLVTLAAAFASLALAWIILRKSYAFMQLLGKEFISVFSRIMGLLIVALAIGFIRKGLGA